MYRQIVLGFPVNGFQQFFRGLNQEVILLQYVQMITVSVARRLFKPF